MKNQWNDWKSSWKQPSKDAPSPRSSPTGTTKEANKFSHQNNLAPHCEEEEYPSANNASKLNDRKLRLSSLFNKTNVVGKQQVQQLLSSSSSSSPPQKQQQQQQQQHQPWSQSVLSTLKRSNTSQSQSSNCSTHHICDEDDDEEDIDNVRIQYDELLLMSARRISFVIPSTRKNNNSNDDKRRASKQDRQRNIKEELEDDSSSQISYGSTGSGDAVSASLDVIPKNWSAASNIGSLLGLDINKNPKTKEFEITEHVFDSKGNNPLLPPQLAILLVPGDYLESVNGISCRRSGDLHQLYERIFKHLEESPIITLTFACLPDEADHNNDNNQRQNHNRRQKRSAFVHQVIYVSDNDNKVQNQSEQSHPTVTEEHKEDEDCSLHSTLVANSAELPQQDRLQLPTTQKEDLTTKTPILRLDAIPKDNWLVHSCVLTGDVILSINSIPCYELYPDDANLVCQTMVQTHPYVSFKFYTPPRTRKESIRRAAVATAGGTMLGAGAVMMVTPLHPIGHAMAIGGLGVLGTEFDGPRKAMTKMAECTRRKPSAEQAKPQPEEQQEVQ